MSDKVQEFVNFSALKYASKTRMNPKKGDIAYCKDEDAKYGFNGKKWEKLVPVGDQQVAAMSNYEANQQIISQLPAMTNEELEDLVTEINLYENDTLNEFHMMLCKEYSYYTVFQYNPLIESEFHSLGRAVVELLKDLGTIRTYHINKGADIELWVTIKKPGIDGVIEDREETYCFHLFPYNLGVVKYG